MNDAYYTETGERSDLAALEVNAPEGYIGTQLMPISPVAEKTGTIYYATVTADTAAQTGRSAGVAPTGTQISDTSTTFTAAEAVKRGAVTPDEAKTMGGIEKADEVGAKWAKRQVMNKLESDIATELIGGTVDATFDAANLLTQVQTGLQTVRLFEGEKVLFGSTAVLKRIVTEMIGDTAFGPVFSRLIAGGSPAEAATGMNFEAWVSALAIFLGVDKVLAGDDTVWDSATYTTNERFGIAKVNNNGDALSHKWQPALGKTFQFMPDGANPWVVQSIADRLNVNNHYDAYNWYDVVTLNAAAVYVLDGVAP